MNKDNIKTNQPEYLVAFIGEIRLTIPDFTPSNEIIQMIQDEIGHTGVIVTELVD